jgi:hypothetical protein
MHLLSFESDGTLSLTEFAGNNIPPYGILSHTWGADAEEVSFKDIRKGRSRDSAGYAKIEFCGRQASKDGLTYFWVDTCCIDKRNLVELSEAITSMFRWYQKAEKCYVYLSDVSVGESVGENQLSSCEWETGFRRSRWFTRGWTLQEPANRCTHTYIV